MKMIYIAFRLEKTSSHVYSAFPFSIFRSNHEEEIHLNELFQGTFNVFNTIIDQTHYGTAFLKKLLFLKDSFNFCSLY